jgi:Zn-dependent protease
VVSTETLVIGTILLAGLLWGLFPRQTYRIRHVARVSTEDLFEASYFQRGKESSSSLIESVEWDAPPVEAGCFTVSGTRIRFEQKVDQDRMQITSICLPVNADNSPKGDLYEVITTISAVEGGARYELVYNFRNQPNVDLKARVFRFLRPLSLMQAPLVMNDALKNAGAFDRYDAVHGPKPAAPSFLGMPLSRTSLALAAAAFAWLYWQDSLWGAVALMLCILFHELGHLLAMRVFGDRDTRFYFIPMFGGVAMGQQRLAADWQLVVIVLAGPAAGLVSAAACWFLYQATDNLWFFACANLFAIINIANLLPIPMLDGGQILNALLRPFVSMEARRWIASGLLSLAVLGGLYVQSTMIVVLFTFFIVLQFMSGDKDPARDRRVLSWTEALASLAAAGIVAFALFSVAKATYGEGIAGFTALLAEGPFQD